MDSGGEMKMKVPSIPFLQKVRRGEVAWVFRHTAKTGGRYEFCGGEKIAHAHETAGFIHIPVALLGRRGVAVLTDSGRAAMAAA